MRTETALVLVMVASVLGCGSGATTGNGSAGAGGHASSGGGSDGGPPLECLGAPATKNTIDECGIFAQADAPAGGNGTKLRPFATLIEAIAEAHTSGKRVYACESTTSAFSEAVTISAGIEVYGGFDCASWRWSQDARTRLNGPADAIALTIEKTASNAKVEGFAITAASPSDVKGGGSSIAVAVDDVAMTLERCDVKASDAAHGADGMTPTDPVTTGADAPKLGENGAPTDACVLPGGVVGGDPGVTTCDDGSTSGGDGGSGGITGTNSGDGVDGVDGAPAANINHGTGASSANDCVDGTKGKGGAVGLAGPAGAAAGDQLLLSGVTNTDVTDGKAGARAQGGDGGGGERSGVFCKVGSNTIDGPGASGGGGGAGGCGGKGGGGGKAGGSSIAIVSLGTKLLLTEVTLAVGKPGNGGKGATGQNGGTGGSGAPGGQASATPPSIPGCKGGDGGLGGAGGPGGGGRGGHAIGIAFAKTPMATPLIKTFTGGTTGGTGGDPGAVGGNVGELGKAGQCWDFQTKMACK